MSAPPPTLAFIGTWEITVVLVVGLLLFGRRLPEVGKQLGRTIVEFRRGLNDLKREIGADSSIREARTAIRDFKRDIDAPRRAFRDMADLADPKRTFERLTDEELASPGPDANFVETPPGTFLPPVDADGDRPPDR